MVDFKTAVQEINPLKEMDYNQLLANGLFGIIIIAFGIILGKAVELALKKISTKLDLQKHIRKSFIDLFIVIIKWSVYLIFKYRNN
jgi:H+/Cl- antiporter ClcA